MIKQLIRYSPLAMPMRSLRACARQLARRVQGLPERHANPYATHLPVLVALAQIVPVRRVAEFGCGMYSTLTFLDRAVFPELIQLDSFENDVAWVERLRAAVGGDSRVRLTPVAGPMSRAVDDLPLYAYDLIFIDDSLTAEERVATIRAVSSARPLPGIVVIHDFEHPLYQHAAADFAQRFRFVALNPNSGVAWDAAHIDEGQLRQLQRVLARHATRVQPDDRAAWLQLLRHTLTGSR